MWRALVFVSTLLCVVESSTILQFRREVFTCDLFDANFTANNADNTTTIAVAYSKQRVAGDTFFKHDVAQTLNIHFKLPTDIIPPDCATYVHRNSTPYLQPPDWDTYENKVEVNSDYTLYWTYEAQAVNGIISIGIEVNVEGWIGFGLSPNDQMTGSDVVVAWIDSAGLPHFADRFAVARSRPPTDFEQGGFDDCFDIRIWQEDSAAPIPVPSPGDDNWTKGGIIALAAAGVVVVVLGAMVIDWWVTSHKKYVDLDAEKAQPNPCGLTRSGLRLVFGAIAIVVGVGIVIAVVLSVDKDELDYEKVKVAIRNTLAADYDDGSLAPLYLRLAWHASGTFSAADNTGGSCTGATMRFDPEQSDPANNGLALARKTLEKVMDEFADQGLTYADLWQLAGIVGVEAMGGPSIPFTSGRDDAVDCAHCPKWVNRLPDGNLDAAHIRFVFDRMGFTDREMVALIGAHTVGHLHKNNSGWDGPWTWTPLKFDNSFFKLLRGTEWHLVNQTNGQSAWMDPSNTLIMIPTDMALLTDQTFRVYVDEFADDETDFFNAFSSAFQKLANLGCPGH